MGPGRKFSPGKMRLLLCPLLPTSGFKRGHHNSEVMSSLQAYFRLHQALFLGRHLAHNNMSQVLHVRAEASGGPEAGKEMVGIP